MKFKKASKPKIILLCALVLVAAVVLTATIPVMLSGNIKNYSFTESKTGAVEFSESAFDVQLNGSKSRKLLINNSNGAVALTSSDGEFVYNSCSAAASDYSLANVIDVRLRDKSGNVYTMNSTDNSVAFGSFDVISQSVKRASIKFNLFPDESAVALGEKADVFAFITLDFTFDGTCFVSSVDTSSVILPKGFCLEKISILPGLFAVNKGIKNESFIIPDGCGAVVDLAQKNQQDFSENFPVYGTDVALYNHSAGAYLPFFAYSKGGCLVNTVITRGDALSEITFKKSAGGGGYVYNTFTVTACGVVKDKYVRGESYSGIISQAYYISEDITDYNAVASQVRDSLIEKNYISNQLSLEISSVPFFINLVGSNDGKNPVTTFEDATEISALLKSRGVKNIAFRFSGAGEKGINTVAGKSLEYSKELGGKDGYKNLTDKMGKNDNLWVDYNMLVKKADYNKRTVELYSTISDFAGFLPTSFSVIGSDSVKKNISRTYKEFEADGSTDLCISDASQLLYTDVKDGVCRQDMLDIIKSGVQTLDVNSSIMLGSPAVYLMKQADTVFSMPEAATLQSYSGVTAVPVLQMVVHGSVVYGTSPMNTTNLSLQDALLKAVEYGAVPSFTFTHNSGSTLDYNAYVSSVAGICESAERTKDLLGMTITSHQNLLSGVYKVTYDYSKTVYVNYNTSVVTVEGIMIPPKDFIII